MEARGSLGVYSEAGDRLAELCASWFGSCFLGFFFWNTAIEFGTDRAQCGVKIVEGISSYECGNEFGAPSK